MKKRPYQLIGEKLLHELSLGNYAIGDRLPPERDIAERMGVSRATVRDAMIMLELEGLIEVRKGSGIYVIDVPVDNTAVSSAINVPHIHHAGLEREMGVFEMLQARQVIESHIAEFAATQITKADILRLESALGDVGDNTGDNEEGDKAFHIAIAEATQNGALVDIAHRLWLQRQTSQSWRVLHNRLSDDAYKEKWLGQHHAILNVLKKKDSAGAKSAMWSHLESVKETLLELSDVDDPSFDGYLFDSYLLSTK